MSPPENPERAFFDAADKLPADDPILQRPYTRLPLDTVVEAARLILKFPGNTAIQRYATPVATFRITPEEYADLLELCRDAAARN